MIFIQIVVHISINWLQLFDFAPFLQLHLPLHLANEGLLGLACLSILFLLLSAPFDLSHVLLLRLLLLIIMILAVVTSCFVA